MEFETQNFPELAPYRGDPPAMAAGGAGKRGVLQLHFERDHTGRTVLRALRRQTPLIAQQALYFDRNLPQMACLYILSAGGPQVDGDRYRIEVRAEADSELFLSTGAATKVASMRHNFVGSRLRIELGARGYLEYLPLPTIPSRHSRLWCGTELVVEPTATLLYTDCYLAGRYHYQQELHAYDLLSLNLEVRRPSGQRLYCERMVRQPSDEQSLGELLSSRRIHFASALILTPHEHQSAIEAALSRFVGLEAKWGFALLRLPHEAGFLCRLTASRSDWLLRRLRQIASSVRQVVKGVPLPEEFPWR